MLLCASIAVSNQLVSIVQFNAMKGIIILGAGWLGKPLAECFASDGRPVEATSRTPASNRLSRQFRLDDDTLTHTLSLKGAYWICAIPPRASDPDSQYLKLLEKALELSTSLSAEGFLLCSSTGVYSEQDGDYDEEGQLARPISKRISVLLEAEQKVLAYGGKVLRLAGLIGPGREPGKFVAGKTLSSSANACVNMVHQQDVINAISTIINDWRNARPIYNLCFPHHPSRQDYYQAHCAATEAPSFIRDTQERRIIIGSAIEELGFRYKHPI